jgi:hypothetical protein
MGGDLPAGNGKVCGRKVGRDGPFHVGPSPAGLAGRGGEGHRRTPGELEIFEATPLLIDLIDDGNEDVRSAAVWSLSQIGGEGVREVLISLLARTEGDSELDFIESALDNLAFTEGMQPFSLFDFPKEDYESAILDILDDEDGLLDFEEDDDNGYPYVEDIEEDEDLPD